MQEFFNKGELVLLLGIFQQYFLLIENRGAEHTEQYVILNKIIHLRIFFFTYTIEQTRDTTLSSSVFFVFLSWTVLFENYSCFRGLDFFHLILGF